MRWKSHPVAVLTGLLLIHMLAHIDRHMISGFSPQVTADLQLSNAQYGFLTGAVWVLSFGFMALFMGTLADRYSRTKVIAFGVFVWSVCTAASGFAQNFEQMVLARFFVATGEAALVPAAVSLIADLFAPRRRSSAAGIFFVGIPLGIGCSFLVAGLLGASHGWRSTFMLLGLVGAAVALPVLLLKDRREADGGHQPGAPLIAQLKSVLAVLRRTPALRQTVAGFVLIHFAFASLSFVQLWLVRERGFDAASIARQMGLLQIVFGTLGAVLGGVASDRFYKRFRGGHASVLALMVLALAPLMLAYRFAAPGSALFYAGMCAGFFLPLASYGPALALLQVLTPVSMRSTITGATMMLINVFAIALGTLLVGALSDRLAAESALALTSMLVATDLLVGLSLWFFWRAARGGDPRLCAAKDLSVVAH